MSVYPRIFSMKKYRAVTAKSKGIIVVIFANYFIRSLFFHRDHYELPFFEVSQLHNVLDSRL